MRNHWKLIIILGAILALRFISLGWLALSDPTEARYADIALRMHTSGDYVTPWIVMDGTTIPYWGKPPLHFWLTSFAFRIFGISEWSARLPGFLAGCFLVFGVVYFAKRIWGPATGLLSGIILASSGLFFFLTAASVTDVTLSAALCGAMISFALAILEKKTSWGLLFFVFLAAGMLIKGPVAIMLSVLSIVLWAAAARQWQSLRALPWKMGFLLFTILSVPWFVIAEERTPGFLHYFFINEHILRYVVHNYGDRYGSGHMYPRGTAWIMLAATFLPWTGLLFLAIRRYWKTKRMWVTYCVAWGLVPALFFTFSRQLLATYLLPGFAALSIVIPVELSMLPRNQSVRTMQVAQLLLIVILALSAICLGWYYHIPILWMILLFGVSFFILLTLFRSANTFSNEVAITGLAFALVVTVASCQLRPVVNDTDSTKPLITALSARGENGPLVFPSGEPYSAPFYETMLSRPTLQLSREASRQLLDQSWDRGSNDIFVFPMSKWLQPVGRDQLHVVYQSPHWIAFRIEPQRH